MRYLQKTLRIDRLHPQRIQNATGEREEMAASAEANGRSREIVQAMVDEEIEIDFILSVGKDTLNSGDIEIIEIEDISGSFVT